MAAFHGCNQLESEVGSHGPELTSQFEGSCTWVTFSSATAYWETEKYILIEIHVCSTARELHGTPWYYGHPKPQPAPGTKNGRLI
jgi:hypothetical protein